MPALRITSASESDLGLPAAAVSRQPCEALLHALKGLFSLIESGQLVRDTSNDTNPNWAMRQIPFVMALSAAQMAITEGELFLQGLPDGEPPQADSNSSSPTWRDCRQCGNPTKAGRCDTCGAPE